MRDNCYSNHEDPIRNCSGVWKKNADTGKIDMCTVKLGKSDLAFTTKNVESMTVKVYENKPEEIKEEIKGEIKEEIKMKQAPVAPSTRLYSFLNNNEVHGVYMANLYTRYRKIPTLAVHGGSRSIKCRGGNFRGGGGLHNHERSGVCCGR